MEVSVSLVAALVFKTSEGLEQVSGGFDSHPSPFQHMLSLRIKMAKFKKIPQPDIDRISRAQESHTAIIPVVFVIFSLAALVYGATRKVYTINGPTIKQAKKWDQKSERQMNTLFREGGFFHPVNSYVKKSNLASPEQIATEKNNVNKLKTELLAMVKELNPQLKSAGQKLLEFDPNKLDQASAAKPKACPT